MPGKLLQNNSLSYIILYIVQYIVNKDIMHQLASKIIILLKILAFTE